MARPDTVSRARCRWWAADLRWLSMRSAHPRSVLKTRGGREVLLKAHQCIWSGRFHGNTLDAIEEALQAPVARAEIDIMLLPEGGWLVLSHDYTLAMRDRLGF